MNLKIKILSFGKKQNDIYANEIDRFVKMCRPWATIEFHYLKTSEPSNESVESALMKEGVLLRKQWGSSAKIVSLGEEGKLLNSYQFAQFLQKTAEESRELIFNIGSAYGLSAEVKSDSDMLLSLSPLTFPYKLCKLIFSEQLYRGLSLCNNHPYHKE